MDLEVARGWASGKKPPGVRDMMYKLLRHAEHLAQLLVWALRLRERQSRSLER